MSKSLTSAERQELESLRALKAQYEAKVAAKITAIKTSAKGAVSVYGLQRWPVTLYASQWLVLADSISKVVEYIKANQSTLASKSNAPAASDKGTVTAAL